MKFPDENRAHHRFGFSIITHQRPSRKRRRNCLGCKEDRGTANAGGRGNGLELKEGQQRRSNPLLELHQSRFNDEKSRFAISAQRTGDASSAWEILHFNKDQLCSP